MTRRTFICVLFLLSWGYSFDISEVMMEKDINSYYSQLEKLNNTLFEGDWHLKTLGVDIDERMLPIPTHGKMRMYFTFDPAAFLINITVMLIMGQYNDDRLLKIEIHDGYLLTKLHQPYSLIFRKRVTISSFNNAMFCYNIPSTQLELELNFQQLFQKTIYFDEDGAQIGIKTDLRIFDSDGPCQAAFDPECMAIHFRSYLNESTQMENAIFYIVLITVLAYIKIKSGHRLARIWDNSPEEAKKMAPAGIVMIGIWDSTTLLDYYCSELCNYSQFSTFVEIYVGIINLYVFVLDMSLFELLLSYKRRDQEADPARSKALAIVYTILVFLAIWGSLSSQWFKLILAFYFVPQIIENACGHLTPFGHPLLLFGSTFYTFTVFYFRMSLTEKICSMSPDYSFCSLYLIIVVIQVYCLILQGTKGPRFFLPEKLLRVLAVEKALICDLDFEEDGDMESECTICLNLLSEDVSKHRVIKPEIKMMLKELGPRKGKIMKTPCKHLFHIECLIEWLIMKQDCPVCRRKFRAFI